MARSNGGCPHFASDTSALLSLYRAMVLTRAFDTEGGGTAAHRPARDLCRVARPGGGLGRHRQRHARGGRSAALLSRQRRAALARRQDGGDPAVIGAATSAAITSPARSRISRFAFRSDRRRRMLPASPMPSSCESEPRVAVCLFGDGATSKGDVWEAMNFAGVHKLPVVFVANNNQWAISVPLRLADRIRDAGAESDRCGLHRRAGRRQRRHRHARRGRRGDRRGPRRQGARASSRR